MATKKTADMSDAELLKNEKLIKGVMYTLPAMCILLLVAGFLLITKKGMTSLFIIPIAMVPILVLNANNLKEIKKEKAARNL